MVEKAAQNSPARHIFIRWSIADRTLVEQIYLMEFVESIPLKFKIQEIDTLTPDYIINFNYTKTYERQYCSNIPVCHIHGICGNEPNNMVLGIDEFFAKEEQNIHVDFAIFKKFVQRIRKHNDVSYAAWADHIDRTRRSRNVKGESGEDVPFIDTSDKTYSDVYVYGHSLDVTDKDILRRFMMSDVTKIHIFARDKATEGELITNLLRIMDEDMVVKKSTSNPPMIEFIELKKLSHG